ncbi:hypothetical protein Gasu2_13180 [Galdieria sulphuraria]|uniref:Uncharacterized protein n=1 Tax=Galdieria sulphuraria TaxID=130081 RepID=M2XG30_GALSU|nr:uncharacterized protein Gasu_35640 [Galdieria sulphuraria]EME28992.1 hypothetical protein Gasu_35640 [Galdieria sulphuraria]GJD06930.1 hypothetical protein Gasu2_13180 [Galdieria sulphuraria]|eukprot:XP_005705512.1 hypothetical protein Gasu_35640 [Galdieria sulphuraria]
MPSLWDLLDKQLDSKLFHALKNRENNNLFHYSLFYREEVSKICFFGDRWGDSSQTYFVQVFHNSNERTVEEVDIIDWNQGLQKVESKRKHTKLQHKLSEECAAEEFAKADLRRGVCRLFIQHHNFAFIQKQAQVLWKLFRIRLDKSSCSASRCFEGKPSVQSFEEIYNKFVLDVVGELFGSFVLKKACLLTHLWIVNEVLTGIGEELEVTRRKHREFTQQLTRCLAVYMFDKEKRISPIGGRRCMQREFSRIHVYGRYIPTGVSGRRRGTGRYVVRGYLVEEAWMKDFCEILRNDFGIIVHLSTEDKLDYRDRYQVTSFPHCNSSSSSSYMSHWAELHSELEKYRDKLDMYLESRFGLDWKSFFRQVLQRVHIRWLKNCEEEERRRLALIAEEYLFWKRLQMEIINKYLYLENCGSLQQIGSLRAFQHCEYLLYSVELPAELQERMENIRRKRNQLYKFTLSSIEITN